MLGTRENPLSLHGQHTKKFKYAIRARNIDADTAARMARQLDSMLSPIVGDIRTAVDSVMAEIDAMMALREADSTYYAQCCLTFAIASPGMTIDMSIAIVQRFMRNLDREFNAVDDVYACITDTSDGGPKVGAVTLGMIARSLFHSLDYIRHIDADMMDRTSLLALNKAGTIRGIADKTSAMAAALYDPHNRVFTLDVHMMRLLCMLYDDGAAGAHTINKTGYDILQSALLTWADDTFPNVPTFAVQWAMWNIQGFGYHVRHLGIFGL